MTKITSEKQFLELVPKLAQESADLNLLDKLVKQDKTDIKEYMLEQDILSAESDGWQVTCSESVKKSMDENKLIEIIQNLIEEADGLDKETFEHLIVMKPTINEQLLEDLIYEERIDKSVIQPAVLEKVSYTLRFKKLKTGKGK